MISLVLFQVALDLIFLCLLFYFWKGRPVAVETLEQVPDERMELMLSALQARAAVMEKEMSQYRIRADEQLAGLMKICDEASRILQRGQFTDSSYPPSTEESELHAALAVESTPDLPAPKIQEPETETIPTLRQIERTKQRLKTDMSVDLRTLLKDQLA